MLLFSFIDKKKKGHCCSLPDSLCCGKLFPHIDKELQWLFYQPVSSYRCTFFKVLMCFLVNVTAWFSKNNLRTDIISAEEAL